jgi:hypothetical protein
MATVQVQVDDSLARQARELGIDVAQVLAGPLAEAVSTAQLPRDARVTVTLTACVAVQGLDEAGDKTEALEQAARCLAATAARRRDRPASSLVGIAYPVLSLEVRLDHVPARRPA